ncbi:heme peroxidase [Paraphaeosphaeria sporulosa]|uniref:Heme peroxidase n=1 Tax=Paraphaeosphaeria sporulosa TaxID=1460663 RepID=A0A177CX37_9PLEO|nr:heme peroxidase [Paraphaeosphaeria sporulosa]OAG11608.1 heme peroxidase [Paraphaeosphaeria sporulosa]
MHTRTLIIATLLPRWQLTLAASTWPAHTDELEDILFLNTGYRSTGFATAVTPCSKGLQPRRVTAAEWLRTAFHDSISGNIYTGEGGLDGSIAWELDTQENEGNFAEDSVAAWAPFVSDLTSLSDVITAATYALTRSCSNISVAVRGGRVDATEAGPLGAVPQPQNAIGIFRNQFARMGLDDKGMIQFVACGHSIGGVHGADHPEITNQDLANFDTTPAILDNQIATEYVSNTTLDPLIVGPSTRNARNSDFKVFNADRNATVRSLATDPQLFASACQSIFQRMIDLVPAGTQLSDPITPYDVKPYALQLVLLDGGSSLRLTGDIRVRTTQRGVSQVQLVYTDRNGVLAETSISTTFKGLAAGFDDTFSFYGFSADLPVETSISSFKVSVTYTDGTQTAFDNNGSGFPVQDTVIYLAPQSCLDSSGKLTVVAAVRNQGAPNLQVLVKMPQASPNPVPSISTTLVPMAMQSAVGAYQLYSADLAFPPSVANPPIFGVFAGSATDARKGVSGLPTGCTTLATASSASASSGSISSSAPIVTTTTSLLSTAISSSSSISLSISSTTSASPTPTSTTTFSFQGCYFDSLNPRALSGHSVADDNMAVDLCAATCSQYHFFGLEYARECYCGNVLDATSSQQSLTDCNMLCAGSSSQLCGGPYRISLYANDKYAVPVNPVVAGYEYKGCYSEGNTSRALLGYSYSAANMSVEYCAQLCDGATYFGVEYGSECYCGATLQSSSVPQPESDCSMLCAGNSSTYCGGPARLSLYLNTTSPRLPVVNPAISNYTYAGCFTDSVEARVLTDVYVANTRMAVEKCAAACERYVWFGTEYGAECYCGGALKNSTRVGEGECGMTCGGNQGEFCGGRNRLSLYRRDA